MFFFLTELSVQVKNNLAISGLIIGINGHQNINQNRTLSFNFSSSQVSNFQNATSFTDFRIKINQFRQLFHLAFPDLTFKKIEDFKIQKDNLVDTIKKARLNNLRAQNAVLLNELNNEKYFSNLEECLTIKPVEVSKLSFVIKPIRKRRAKLIPNKISFTKE